MDYQWSEEPFLDKFTDLRLAKMIFEGPDRLSMGKQVEFMSLPWDELVENPQCIGLPTPIYFQPAKGKKSKLPVYKEEQKLWGVLMTMKDFGAKKRPRFDGIVFVCGEQRCPPNIFHLTPCELYDWAIDENNVPGGLRFHSMPFTIKKMCGKGAVYETESTRPDGYFQGSKNWVVAEWGLTVDELLRREVPFLESSDTLPPHMTPKKPRKSLPTTKKPGRKRKRTPFKDPDNDPEPFNCELPAELSLSPIPQ